LVAFLRTAMTFQQISLTYKLVTLKSITRAGCGPGVEKVENPALQGLFYPLTVEG
jgi:hypothetical protein